MNGHMRLYNFLRQCEASGVSFTVRAAAMETALEESSVRTYLSKRLRGYVTKVGRGRFAARGVRELAPREFEAVMCQTIDVQSEAGWSALLREVVRIGRKYQYRVDDLVLEAVTSEG